MVTLSASGKSGSFLMNGHTARENHSLTMDSVCVYISINARVVVMCSCKYVFVAKSAISQCRQGNTQQMQWLLHKLISAFNAEQCKL